MASLTPIFTFECGDNANIITVENMGDAPGTTSQGSYTWDVIEQATNINYGGTVEPGNYLLVPNGMYKIRFFAVYDDGTTAASIITSRTLTCPTVQPTPKSMTISWIAPTPAPALGYIVSYRIQNSGDPFTDVFVQASPYVVTVVPAGYGYEVMVRARCSTTVNSVPVSYP